MAELLACRHTRRTDCCGLLHEGWQIVIAVCLLVITAVGLARLVGRGPTRMANGVFVTGFLIVAITVVGTLAVSCSGDSDGAARVPAPGRPLTAPRTDPVRERPCRELTTGRTHRADTYAHAAATPDFESFAGAVLPWLARAPVDNNVLSTVVGGRTAWRRPPRAGRGVAGRRRRARIASSGVATVTPPGGALLSVDARAAAEAMAEHVAASDAWAGPCRPSWGPIGDEQPRSRDGFTERTARAAHVTAGSAGVPAAGGVAASARTRDWREPRAARTATVLVAWSSAFAAEATPSQPAPNPAMPVDSRLAATALEPELPLLWLWEVDWRATSRRPG